MIPGSNKVWSSIQGGSEGGLIRAKLDEIAVSLTQYRESLPPGFPGLIEGKAGIALFFIYYSQFKQVQDYYDTGIELLFEVLEDAGGDQIIQTFGMGLAGIGWSIEHLVREKLLEADTDEMLEELDPVIFRAMKLDLMKRNYDLFHGAMGCGMYFLERFSSGIKEAGAYLDHLLEALNDIGERGPGGEIKWLSFLDHTRKMSGYNIGLCHGIPSIIVFLTRLFEKGINRERTLELIQGAVTYLLRQRLTGSDFISLFPNLALETEPPRTSRLAWCYGDPGIGIALLQAGLVCEVKEWEKEAIEILKHCTGRRGLVENNVHDAGLCHGAVGIGHIFNRAYHYTSEPEFKEAALYWYGRALEYARFDDGIAGFKTWAHGEYRPGKPGFLEGAAGIGLGLMAAVSDREPRWDRILLLR